jgi:HAD superfamily hydrolase (TIGR01484 family)
VNYEALIFDLDGTAMPHSIQARPSARLITVIDRARGCLRLCAATGRSMAMAEQVLGMLRLTDPCVVSGGTRIINPVSGAVIWERIINENDANKVLGLCHEFEYEVLVDNEVMGQGARASRRRITGPVNIIYIMSCRLGDAEVIAFRLESVPQVSVVVTKAWVGEGADIHITDRHGTKEQAITQLLAMMDIAKDRSIGVGDGDNDIHLFKAVGRRVAMGNATERLKSMADEVCDTAEHDGLAQVIEALLRRHVR